MRNNSLTKMFSAFRLEWLRQMAARKLSFFALFLSSAGLLAVLAASVAHSAATRPDQPQKPVLATAAERAFPDAPDGVDAVVTGPTSAEFKNRQAAAGCEQMAWPNISLVCYPG